jgi:hypothetical protein
LPADLDGFDITFRCFDWLYEHTKRFRSNNTTKGDSKGGGNVLNGSYKRKRTKKEPKEKNETNVRCPSYFFISFILQYLIITYHLSMAMYVLLVQKKKNKMQGM